MIEETLRTNIGTATAEACPLWVMEKTLGSVSSSIFLEDPHTPALALGTAGNKVTTLLYKLHLIYSLQAQTVSPWAFILDGSHTALLVPLAFVSKKRDAVVWEEGLMCGNKYNRSGRWDVWPYIPCVASSANGVGQGKGYCVCATFGGGCAPGEVGGVEWALLLC